MNTTFTFDSRACQVERSEDDNYVVHWQGNQPDEEVAIYIADSPEQFHASRDLGKPAARTTQHQVRLHNPDRSVRHYFYLKPEHGEGIEIAERQVWLQGSPNFRDLGGYETREGQRLRWGKIFRSGKLSTLTNEDMDYVHRLGISLICDFRKEEEQQLDPSRLPLHSLANIVSLPITPGSSNSFMDNLGKGIIDVADSAVFMEEINRDFVTSQSEQYANMFRLLLAEEHQMLVHCASGKDRTGFAAALILDVLGVDEELIVHDYLLTNNYLPVDEEVERLSALFTDQSGRALGEEVLRPLIEVRPQYIKACFDEIHKLYDSRQHYFEQALGLDPHKIAKLRERYLLSS